MTREDLDTLNEGLGRSETSVAEELGTDRETLCSWQSGEEDVPSWAAKRIRTLRKATEAERSLAQCRDTITSLTRELATLTRELEHARGDLSQQTTQNEFLMERLRELEQVRSELQDQNNELLTERVTLRAQVEAWEEKSQRDVRLDLPEDVREAFARLHLSPDAPPGVIKAVYRRLSMDAHPDRGGDDESMKALNDAMGRIREFLPDLETPAPSPD